MEQAIAQPVQGRFTAERALQEALRGQPLQLQRNADGSYRLVEVKEGALNLSPLDVNAHAASLDTSNGYVDYTRTDTEITKSNGGDKGNETPHVPKNMASAWISYSFHDGALQGLRL